MTEEEIDKMADEYIVKVGIHDRPDITRHDFTEGVKAGFKAYEQRHKKEIDLLKNETERLKTTLVAGAELIKEKWDKLCDEEGYGPQNLLLRMDGTLNTSGYPGYSSGEFEKMQTEILVRWLRLFAGG